MKDDLEIKLSRRSILKGSSALALVLAGSTIIARNVEADSKLTSEAIKKSSWEQNSFSRESIH